MTAVPPGALSTLTGVGAVTAVPSPSCEALLRPQHLMAPPVSRAQVCASKLVMDCAPVSEPTLTGVVTGVGEVVPLPTCATLLSPQHITLPPANTAQECTSPRASPVTPAPRPCTVTGTSRCTSVPSPSWPR